MCFFQLLRQGVFRPVPSSPAQAKSPFESPGHTPQRGLAPVRRFQPVPRRFTKIPKIFQLRCRARSALCRAHFQATVILPGCVAQLHGNVKRRCLRQRPAHSTIMADKRRRSFPMLSENIKAIRKSRGLSQQELAVKLNVVRQTVSKWEQGVSQS